MKTDIWILSADAHKARLFCASAPRSMEVVEIKTFLQPDTVLHERDIVSDGLGSYSQRAGQLGGAQHHAKLPRTLPKTKRLQEFARQVCSYLDAEHKRGNFSKLGLVVEPQMLGELRTQFSSALEKDISFAIDKNFTQLSGLEFRRHLPANLAAGC